MTKATTFVLLAATLAGGPAAADVWDFGAGNDNMFDTTRNELVHGVTQVHDLATRAGGVVDQDWFAIAQKPYSSYEVVLDGLTADLNLSTAPLAPYRMDATFNLLQQAKGVTNFKKSMSLRWRNNTAQPVNGEYLVVDARCDGNCGPDDRYRIRAFETTISVARFNNAQGQLTVLLAQNSSAEEVAATVYYWSPTGALLFSQELFLGPKELKSINLSQIPQLQGQGGSITIAHDAPYGRLSVKTVAVEPSGFSFDTPGVYRGF